MGHHQGVRMRAEVGSKGLLGDGSRDVVRLGAIPERSGQSTASRIHRRSQEADLLQQLRCDRSLMFGMAVGVHHQWSLVGREFGSPRMLLPSLQQEGFEIGGVGGKCFGGRSRDICLQFFPVLLNGAATGWFQCDNTYGGVLLTELFQGRSRSFDVLSGRPEPSDRNIGTPTAANVLQDHLVSERLQDLYRRKAKVGVVEAGKAVGHQNHTGICA